ncbi:MAG: BadF/BadG/BcrA/BcrD ATPase family protein [Desulfurococcaceae archaeon]
MLIGSFDSGASTTKFAVSNEEGEVVLKGIGPHGNPFAIGVNRVVERLYNMYLKVIDHLTESNIRSLIFGLTGYSPLMANALMKKLSTCGCEITIVDDKVLALEGSLGGERGIVVYAGTGSFAITRDSSGNIVTSGDLGYILGDEGGGFYIAHKAIRAFIRSIDGRGESSKLTEEIGRKLMNMYRASNINELFYRLYSRRIDVGKIAKLASIVTKLAEKGDKQSLEIIRDAVSELALMTHAVAKRADLLNKPFLLTYSGNVFNSSIFTKMFKEEINRSMPYAKVIEPVLPPVLGGIILGLKQLGIPISKTIIEKARSTFIKSASLDLRSY